MVLSIEMSIVNLKLIFLWKSKSRHANAQLKAGARNSFITEMAVFTLEGLFVWNGLSVASLYPSILTNFEDGLFVSDTLCTAAPSPQKKSERGCLWVRGWLYTGLSKTDNLFLALVLKLPITKFPCPVAKDCTERLSAVALSIGLIIPRG